MPNSLDVASGSSRTTSRLSEPDRVYEVRSAPKWLRQALSARAGRPGDQLARSLSVLWLQLSPYLAALMLSAVDVDV